jgi:hypothetical protein
MRPTRAIGCAARDSRGAVLVIAALTLPVLIGVGGMVVDVGNWFSHKRHLQVQADAGALAAAGKFRIPCTPSTIVTEAQRYSSVEYTGTSGYTPGPGFNPQTGGTPPDRLQSEINSKTFYNQPTPVDDTVVEGNPCAAKMIDVKLTETDLPWFLKLAQVKYINAQARVEIKKMTTGKGALPVGVPEVGPQKAKALFVDETTGTVIASSNLLRTGTANGLAMWSNAAAPVGVTVNASKIGVRIVVSGSTSTTCGDPLVNCYGAGTNAAIVAGTAGLVHVRGWSTAPAATATAPQARNVDLLAGSCEDGGFTAIAATNPCTVNVAATIDFGPTPPALATTRVLALRTGAKVNTAIALSPPAVIGGVWTGGAIPVDRAEGAVGVDLIWQSGCPINRATACNNPPSSGSLGTVQRTFAGNESLAISGPVKLLRLTESAVPPANSFQRCPTCTHNLVVTLGLKGSLQNAQSVADPVVSLKVAGGGSQNQGLDCDPAQSNYRDQLANGCAPTYAVNTGTPCPVKNTLWASAQPWNCVVINTGAVVGQVTQGLNLRILGDTGAKVCTAPNHWASFPELPLGDPRIINVFLTPFGAFDASGGTTVPVTGFATFYVTGWDGGACQGSGDDSAGQGQIVGHYIKYIDIVNNGGGGEEFCDFDSLGSCVAVFTR